MSTREKPLSEVLSLPAMLMYSMSIFLFCFVVITLLTCKISGLLDGDPFSRLSLARWSRRRRVKVFSCLYT